MKRTKIAWVRNQDGSQGYTWNPVTGCLHGCNYCYARRITERFPYLYYTDHNPVIYRWGNPFAPHFYEERLREPIRIKKPSTIFVCSMADLFGDWVDGEWIEQIMKVVEECPRHTFLFLTKNGGRMCREGNVVDTENAWYGQTCTGIADRPLVDVNQRRHFISFEPLLGDWIPDIKFLFVRWVIIGSLNKNGIPVRQEDGGTRKEWVLSLLERADECGIPVFVKPELYRLYPDLPKRQEVPYLERKR